ncbi:MULTISPECIES: DUF7079 family protein [Pseudomonas]|uniref:DUF7079 domain-containing protein n=1 Tax=Pseudomonas segetis TaxID=298908 RepID=A0A239IJ23_9PSED|nr:MULTISPECIES: hypothetical protein [Pseudomonas]SNS93650.1 hypothetical protein SAMN05216255_3914 [Pseudomonas segetis]
MEYVLSPHERARIRAVLSEAFNDLPVDYDYLAEQVKDVDPKVLHEILYSEVAPLCFSNLAAPVPPVWTGFEPDSLNAMIDQRLAARERHWLRRQFDKILIRWLSYNYAYIWQEITRRIK